MPKVSIIIATRNRSELLRSAVDSARNAGSDIEIVVVDDASDDSTRELCSGWTDILYLRARRRLGPGRARNAGIIASTCEYISFLDDDDVRLPGSIDAQVKLLEERPKVGMVYGRVRYRNQQGQPAEDSYPEQCPQGDVFRKLLHWNFVPCPSVVFRRSCLQRVGLLEQEADGLEDWDLWVRIAELYEAVAVEEAVAIWRKPNFDSGQFTSRPERLHRLAHRLHRDKWLKLPRASEISGSERRQIIRAFVERAADQLIWAAAERASSGQVRDFARVTTTLAGMYPLTGSRRAVVAVARRLL